MDLKSKAGAIGTVGIVLIVVAAIVLGLLGWGVGTYNSLVSKREDIQNQWAQVEVQYQLRFDKFASLEELGSAALAQERGIFETITEARKAYAGAATAQDKVTAMNEYEGQISSGLTSLLVIVEDNPEIQSQATVMQLIHEVSGTQNQIATEVRRYNDQITEYNKMIKTIPTKLIAGWFGFGEDWQRVEAPEEVTQNPEIDLGVE